MSNPSPMMSSTFLRGVQAGHGILEDHLHLGAQGVVLCVAQVSADVLPVKGDPACGGVVQPDDAPADGGLAGAGFAHQTIGLAGVDLKAHVVHSLNGEVLVHLEILFQALYFQKRVALCAAIYSASLIFFCIRFHAADALGQLRRHFHLGGPGSSSQVAA